MNAYLRMCRIEALKLRRTLALWMVLVAPLLVVLLQLMIWTRSRDGFDVDVDLWLSFLRNVLSMWAVFMEPLFVALVVALLYHLDHGSQGWLRMFLLPVPRWTVPAAKLTLAIGMVVAATLILALASTGATFLASLLNPKIVLPEEIPVAAIATRSARVLVASLVVAVIQNAVSLRFSSLTISLGVGVTGTFVALFATSWEHGPYFPWLMALYSVHGKDELVARLAWLTPTLTVVIAAATLIYAARRDPGEWV